MPFELIIGAVHKLLSHNGIFCVVLPRKREEEFANLAEKAGLFPLKITRVKGTPDSEEKRSLMAFSFQNITPEIDELIIENSRHNYTENYIALVKDFYLKM